MLFFVVAAALLFSSLGDATSTYNYCETSKFVKFMEACPSPLTPCEDYDYFMMSSGDYIENSVCVTAKFKIYDDYISFTTFFIKHTCDGVSQYNVTVILVSSDDGRSYFCQDTLSYYYVYALYEYKVFILFICTRGESCYCEDYHSAYMFVADEYWNHPCTQDHLDAAYTILYTIGYKERYSLTTSPQCFPSNMPYYTTVYQGVTVSFDFDFEAEIVINNNVPCPADLYSCNNLYLDCYKNIICKEEDETCVEIPPCDYPDEEDSDEEDDLDCCN